MSTVQWSNRFNDMSSYYTFNNGKLENQVILIERTDPTMLINGGVLSIAEVRFYLSDTLLSTSLFTFHGSNHDGYNRPWYANDRNLDSVYVNNYNGGNRQFLIITTDLSTKFDKVVVNNRWDCCQDSLVNASIKVYNLSDNNQVVIIIVYYKYSTMLLIIIIIF